MKILLVSYQHLDNNSGIHIFNIANQLILAGLECAVCVPYDKEKVFELGHPLFKIFTPNEIRHNGLMKSIDLIHVWTPREMTRKITQELLEIKICPYIIHLEDNEEFLMEVQTKIPSHLFTKLPGFLLNLLIRPYMSHPKRYFGFLSGASGISMITEALEKFCPLNIPHEFIWAGYQEDMQWDAPSDHTLKDQLGITDSDFLVAYTGNVHLANQEEVATLYEAIKEVNNQGFSVKLIRTGLNYTSFLKNMPWTKNQKFFIDLGRIPRKHLPSVLSIADVLIQPGTSNQFNDYRFPSKIPEYLASGKPVILPRANIGLHLRDNEECVLLEEGSVNEIAKELGLLLMNENLRKKIGSNGRLFAEQHLKWSIITKKLISFYRLTIKNYRIQQTIKPN